MLGESLATMIRPTREGGVGGMSYGSDEGLAGCGDRLKPMPRSPLAHAVRERRTVPLQPCGARALRHVRIPSTNAHTVHVQYLCDPSLAASCSRGQQLSPNPHQAHARTHTHPSRATLPRR